MTNPTPLSPAAQAVVWAYDTAPEKETGNHRYHWLAAALRAAADQVVPEQLPMLDHAGLRQNRLRHELLAIADELDGGAQCRNVSRLIPQPHQHPRCGSSGGK